MNCFNSPTVSMVMCVAFMAEEPLVCASWADSLDSRRSLSSARAGGGNDRKRTQMPPGWQRYGPYFFHSQLDNGGLFPARLGKIAMHFGRFLFFFSLLRLLPLVQHPLMLEVFTAHRLHENSSRRFAQQLDKPQIQLLAARRREAAPKRAHLKSFESVVQAGFAEALADAVIHDVINHQAEGFIYHLKRKGW